MAPGQGAVFRCDAVHAAAHGDQQIRIVQGSLLIGQAVDLQMPGIGGVIIGKGILPAIGAHHRCAHGLGQGGQWRGSVLDGDDLARQQQWPLGLRQHLRRLVQCSGV